MRVAICTSLLYLQTALPHLRPEIPPSLRPSISTVIPSLTYFCSAPLRSAPLRTSENKAPAPVRSPQSAGLSPAPSSHTISYHTMSLPAQSCITLHFTPIPPHLHTSIPPYYFLTTSFSTQRNPNQRRENKTTTTKVQSPKNPMPENP